MGVAQDAAGARYARRWFLLAVWGAFLVGWAGAASAAADLGARSEVRWLLGAAAAAVGRGEGRVWWQVGGFSVVRSA